MTPSLFKKISFASFFIISLFFVCISAQTVTAQTSEATSPWEELLQNSSQPNQSDNTSTNLPVDVGNTSSGGANQSTSPPPEPVTPLPIDIGNTSSDGVNQSYNPSASGGGGGTGLSYRFIESLPGIGPILTGSGPGTLFVDYVGRIYVLVLGAAAILALFMLILGGVQYTYVALSPSAKNDAKERIYNALIGLLIVLGAYLILNTINPDFVRMDLSIEPIDGGGGFGGAPSTKPLPPGSVIGSPGVSVPWNQEREDANRARLESWPNVKINKKSCKGVRYQSVPGGCTDVGGLSERAMSSIESMAGDCNCIISITGGSEAGHSTHNGGTRMDISQNVDQRTNSYIRSKPQVTCPDNSRWTAYQVGNGVFCDERVGGDPHWHVAY